MEHLYKIMETLETNLKEQGEQAARGLDDRKLDRIDKLSHALKSLECVIAMRESDSDEYSERSYGNSMNHSGRRMRSSRTGRWYSGDGGNSMDGGNADGDHSMARSRNSYGEQDMARKLREMANMMEQNQGNN